MSLYDNASLVMIPSGVKEDKLYSVKPTDGSGDFTFSRGSDIQATRVNASGLIEKAKENKVLYSQDFSNAAWSAAAGTTLTHGQTDPNGGTTATKIDFSASGQAFEQEISGFSTSNIYAFSIYVRCDSGTIDFEMGNLNALAFETRTATTEWQRFTIYQQPSATTRYPRFVQSKSASTLYIAFAQLNHGLVAQDYVETTTTAVVEGLTADLPRLDYSGGASCPNLLLEPSRTNSIAHSEYSGAFALINFTRTQNSTTSPEGVINASTLSSDTTNGGHYFGFNAVAATSGSPYTGSLFVKKDTGRYFQLLWGSGAFGTTEYANFDLEEGVVSFEGAAATASIEPFLDGWYRVSISATATSTASETFYGSAITSGTSARIEVHSTALSYFIYGVQIEENSSYPTSYIPTYGTAANRGADSCVASSASALIGATEGTIAGEFTFKSAEGTNRLFSISGADWNTIGHIRFDMINLRPQAKIRTTGADVAEVIGTEDIAIGSLVKFAVVYTSTTFKAFVNGAQIGSTDTLTGSLPAMDEVVIDALGGAFSNNNQNNQLNPYKQALVFKTALTDAEAIALTTI